MFLTKAGRLKKKQKISKLKSFKKASKSVFFSWLKAIFLALVVLLIIRILAFQTILIPSSSMAGNLIPGDWVVINKAIYGARLPITPFTLPFKSFRTRQETGKYFVDWIKLPYLRLPGYGTIKRNDIIIFNYPLEDDLPIDMRIVNIKRCVALPGDTIKINNNELYVNTKRVEINNVQFEYFLRVKGKSLNKNLIDKYQINEGGEVSNYGEYELFLSALQADGLRKEKNIAAIERESKYSSIDKSYLFPHDSKLEWTLDNYGPVVVPKVGQKLLINKKNLLLYSEILERYEGCLISISNDSIYINKEYTKSYVLKSNYYFVLDDNRDNAKDSRLWGFLPENHIIGKVSFILTSFNPSASGLSKIRWKRTFRIPEK
jgi:signal peptidase I